MPTTITDTGMTKPVVLSLYNLSCSADTHSIEQMLKREPGVVKVYANPATEKAYIEYKVALTNPDRLRDLLQKAGFGRKTGQVTCKHCR